MLAKRLIQTSTPSIVRGFRRHSFMTSAMAPPKDYDSIPAFHEKLLRSKRILAVCGAGLSAASGLPTFRGAGGLWRNHEATQLATPEAFRDDPGLVWLFYAYVSPLSEPNTHRSNKMLTFTPRGATWPSKYSPTRATTPSPPSPSTTPTSCVSRKTLTVNTPNQPLSPDSNPA